MARRNKQGDHANHERWLVSYADFITLLFAFFVVMFANSNTDKAKLRKIEESVKRALSQGQFASAIAGMLGSAPPGVHPSKGEAEAVGGERKDGRFVELLPAMRVLTKELEQEIANGRMQVNMEPRGLVISFRQAAFFPSGTDEIPPETYSTVEKVARVIRRIPNPVRLEGHTDSVPIHNEKFQSNWELSTARSIAMLELICGRFGVPRERMSVAGYAENAPVSVNDTEEGRKRNRRVDIVILNETGVQAEPGMAGQSANAPNPAH